MNIFIHSFGGKSALQPGLTGGIQKFLRVFLFVSAVCFIVAVIFIGAEGVSQILKPKIIMTAQVMMGCFILVVYPLSKAAVIRKFLIIPSFVLASLLAALGWAYALLFVMTALGIWGVLCCFFFQVLTPIAIMGAVFKGEWGVVGNLTLWLMGSYLIKFFAVKLSLTAVMPKRSKDRIIDVEATVKE